MPVSRRPTHYRKDREMKPEDCPETCKNCPHEFHGYAKCSTCGCVGTYRVKVDLRNVPTAELLAMLRKCDDELLELAGRSAERRNAGTDERPRIKQAQPLTDEIGIPFAGSFCGTCGRRADDHFQRGHAWRQTECQRDKDGRHVWSQSGDGGDAPCSVCKRRNPKYFPEDWARDRMAQQAQPVPDDQEGGAS